MTLLEKISRDGIITLNPGGLQDGEPIVGYVSDAWFNKNFPSVAQAKVPLAESAYETLRTIDDFWKQNAERWRSEGLI